MECFQYLVESMPRTIKAVLKTKGGPTWYLQGVPNKVIVEYIEKALNRICNAYILHCHLNTEP